MIRPLCLLAVGLIVLISNRVQALQDPEPAAPIPVRSEVVETTILSLVPDGTMVQKYQIICEFDDSDLRERLASQQIATERARADFLNAQKTFEVKEIDVEEYIQGIYPQELRTIEGEIALAQSELARAEDRLKWSDNMFKRELISQVQNVADRFDLQKAEFQLQQARQKREILEKYSKPKQITTLKGEVERARADVFAKESAFHLEKEKEVRLRRMIEKCQVFAPVAGTVSPGEIVEGNERRPLAEGARVRERQVLFEILPEPANPDDNEPGDRGALLERLESRQEQLLREPGPN